MKYWLHTSLLLLFAIVVIISAKCQTAKLSIGINLCGAEFGGKNLPGVINQDYIYPTEKEVQYFANKGFKLMVLPEPLGPKSNMIALVIIMSLKNMARNQSKSRILYPPAEKLLSSRFNGSIRS